MLNMTLREIASVAKGELHAPENIVVHDITTDTRSLKEGALFIAIEGERFDGHDFLATAVENGASCVMVHKAVDIDIPHIIVDDTVLGYLRIAAYHREKISPYTIGITGSVGKTTTKECVAAALGARFCVHKNNANKNNHIGVPDTLLALKEEHEVAVIEMGTNHFGEIDILARAVQPDICLFTNIGEAHIEHFGSRMGILQGKTEMLAHRRPDSYIIVNGDDDMLNTLSNKSLLKYGLSHECDYRAENIKNEDLLGISFDVIANGDNRGRISIASPGMHMVYNALAAYAVADILKMTHVEIQKGLENYEGTGARMRIEERNGKTIIDDAYNASPSAMRAAIDVLKSRDTRKVCILGDMLELGDDAPEYHREVGRYAAECDIDCIIAAGPLAMYIYEGAHEKRANAHYFKTKEELIEKIDSLIQNGDTVLVKASNSMGFSKIIKEL